MILKPVDVGRCLGHLRRGHAILVKASDKSDELFELMNTIGTAIHLVALEIGKDVKLRTACRIQK